MYKKNNVPGDAARLPAFLDQELSLLEKSQTDPRMMVRLIILNAEPRFVDDGRSVAMVFADGTNWNPGSGRGTYVGVPGSWTFIG